MERFNSNEEIEETPRSIAKDIIYSNLTMEEQVIAIEKAILETETKYIKRANELQGIKRQVNP